MPTPIVEAEAAACVVHVPGFVLDALLPSTCRGRLEASHLTQRFRSRSAVGMAERFAARCADTRHLVEQNRACALRETIDRPHVWQRLIFSL